MAEDKAQGNAETKKKSAETAEKQAKEEKRDAVSEAKKKPDVKAKKKGAEKIVKNRAGAEEKKPEPKKKVKRWVKQSAYAKKKAKSKTSLEKHKPRFKRLNAVRIRRVKDVWRKPSGIDSRHREQIRAKPAHPRSGYKTPGEVRGLHPSGFMPIRVHNLREIDGIDSEKEAIVIASSVGKKKRAELQNAAKGKGIQILNFKDV